MLIQIGELYDKDNSTESINERKSLIINNINLYKQYNLCNEINLTGFFPHLDIVDEIISIRSLSGEIPCWELGEDTIYAEITYTDSCHISSDENKCLEPVPNLNETKFIRNTLTDIEANGTEYKWSITSNNDQIQIIGKLTNKTLKVAAVPSAYLDSISINLEYSE